MTPPGITVTVTTGVRKVYPAGALVRVTEICRNTRTGQPGLLPINRATWYRWVANGTAPAGRKLGQKTTVWPVEQVLALGAQAAGDDA